jgi:cell division control protein 24
MVQEIISRIESSNLLPPQKPFPFTIPTCKLNVDGDNRSKVIMELLNTERTYILALEELQQYMRECEQTKILTKEATYAMFANLNDLLDFQRRFLIAMEGTLVLPINEQRIGLLFSINVSSYYSLTCTCTHDLIKESSFEVYHAFCSNYNFACNMALEETENLKVLIIPVMNIH